MDSLPQEIIDEIIDNLPRSSLLSSSLIAKRWRKRSQQRALDFIRFDSELRVNSWYIDTHEDPRRIPSYIQVAKFCNITTWMDPTLFGRVLQNFTSLTTLRAYQTELPDEMQEQISCGEFRKTITTLHLSYPRCSLSTAISLITASPNLQNLIIDSFETASREATPACRVLQQRRPLNLLQVAGCMDGVAQALVSLHFASRRLVLDVQSQNIQNLLVLSSATVVELELAGTCSLPVDHKSVDDSYTDCPNQSTSYPIDLPPFPALTSLTLWVYRSSPSPHLVNTLSRISSARALASITLQFWWWFSPEPDPPNVWDHLDRWLVKMAENTTVEGGLVLNLMEWQDNGVPEEFLPKFQEVGKIITHN